MNVSVFLHELSEHVRYSIGAPGQLSFSAEAAGFWHVRILVCVPVPHVFVQADQSDQGVHPTGPVAEETRS